MKTTSSRGLLARRLLLLINGTVAVGIAVTILFAPHGFYAAYGIDLAGNTNLTNELKAPAGVLFVSGFLMLAGMFRTQLMTASLIAATAIYLPYGLSRLLSIAIDGVPDGGLVAAAVFEISVGAVCLLALKPALGGRLAQAVS